MLLVSLWRRDGQVMQRWTHKEPQFYAFFWVIPRRLNFICLFHRHRQVGACSSFYTHLPASEDGTDVPKRRHINSDAGESPKRKHTAFRTRRKFEIKETAVLFCKPERKKDIYGSVRIIWNWILRKWDGIGWTGFIWLKAGKMAGCSELGNEFVGSSSSAFG